jgi:hypothetical protein
LENAELKASPVALNSSGEAASENPKNHSVPCRDQNRCTREDIDVLLLARFS